MENDEKRLVQVFKTCLAWLGKVQPKDAAVSQFGIYPPFAGIIAGEPMIIHFFSSDAVCAMELANKYSEPGQERRMGKAVESRVLDCAKAAGVVDEHWNGAKCAIISVRFKVQVHPSLVQARRRYSDFNCPSCGFFCKCKDNKLEKAMAKLRRPKGWQAA